MTRRLPALLFLGALIACGNPAPGGNEADAVRSVAGDTASFAVEADSLPILVPVDGTVEARQRAVLSTRLMARVTEVAVDVGDRVRAGQTLVRLGTDDIAANRTRAMAAVRSAEAARDEAARHLARMDTLLADDVVPRVQRDQASLGLTRAESQLAMARAALADVETAGRYARVRAPFAGVVVRRDVHAGDLAAPGRPLVTLEGSGAREVVFSVSTEVAAGLKPGTAVTVAYRGGQTEAPVRAVAGGADRATRTVEVRATLPDDWPTGIAVRVLVPAGRRLGIAIPASAVVHRGQLTGVRVATPDGVVLRWIRLGRTLPDDDAGNRVEVLSGLEAGERIVP